jgi:hypothetical protein
VTHEHPSLYHLVEVWRVFTMNAIYPWHLALGVEGHHDSSLEH